MTNRDIDDNDYTDSHRLLLQVMVSRRMLEESDLHAICKSLFAAGTRLKDIVKDINRKLDALKVEIKSQVCEVTGKTMYVYCPKVKHGCSSLEKRLGPAQKTLISKIFNEVITSGSGMVNYETVLRLNETLCNKGMKPLDTRCMIDELIEEKMLMPVEDEDYFCFTALAVAELEPEFKEAFGEHIAECPLCNHTVFVGLSCPACPRRFHMHCFRNYSQRTKKSRCCDCKVEIPMNF